MATKKSDSHQQSILIAPAPIIRGAWRAKRGSRRVAVRWECEALPRPPLLDSMVGSARTDIVHAKASRKRRRAYHRLRTGLSFHYGERLRFLTLTLIKGSENDIHRCFRAFKERVRRLTPNKIRIQDTERYFTENKMRQYFGKKKIWDKPIRFEYFSVIVNGERPHIHILYFGNWLPHAWLKKVWYEITMDSDIVDITTTKGGVINEKRLAGYVLAQYALFQEGDIRFQMSQGWAWRGMVRDWKKAVKKFTNKVRGRYNVRFKELLTYWVTLVRSQNVGRKITYQSDLIEQGRDSIIWKKYQV